MEEKIKPGGWKPASTDEYRPKRERNARIRELHAKGVTQSELAKMYGLARQRIHVIVKRGNETLT